MPVAIGLFGVFLWVMASILARWAVQTWRGQGRPVSTQMRRSSFRDEESLAGTDRTVLVMSVMFASMGTASVCTAIGGVHFTHRNPWLWIGGVAVFVFLACTPIYASIVNFNRPKFLVPPPLRDELGARAGRRQRKQEWREV